MGFEAMPQIVDLEIAATWDEIELEAALQSRSAEAQSEPSAETPVFLTEAVRAIEELKHLPKAERKRRAEELLRTLTGTAPTQAPEPGAAPESSEPLAPPPSEEPFVEPPELPALPAGVEPGVAQAEPEAPEIAAPTPEASVLESPEAPALAAESPATVSSASEIAAVAPVAEMVELAPAVAAEPCAIPRFLATECASLEDQQPDSLIPLRTVAAAGALIGAVMLVYFWSSQEFGVAARTLTGAGIVSETRAVQAEIPVSLAVRQAFVALPPVDSAASELVRSYRPPFVGFDFLDDPVPPATVAKAEALPARSQPALVVPQSSAAETAASPALPNAETAALIQRGDALLKAGDIAAARSAYERAAAGGSAKAQIGIGKTYDPLVLAKLGVRGVRGDPVQAASWYARAGETGDEEGQQRLHALVSGLSDCLLAQKTCGTRKP